MFPSTPRLEGVYVPVRFKECSLLTWRLRAGGLS